MSMSILRRPRELVAAGLISPEDEADVVAVAERFTVAITPHIASLIDADDPNDPIALQFVPRKAELVDTPEELADPTGDARHSPLKGLIHRYPDRVLLKPTHACAAYCRFCFRRETVGEGGEALNETEMAAIFDYIRDHPEIWEVILSGGDPFMLSPRRVGEIIRQLDAISHVKVIRFHTRLPIVDPERVTDALADALATEKSLWVVIHANHPRELTPEVRCACKKLSGRGIPLLSQSVLLRGVNDDVATLTALFRALVAMGVKPYYLHHGDMARGTAHFRTSLEDGLELMRRLQFEVSGLCVPAYMLDIPGGGGKVPVGMVE